MRYTQTPPAIKISTVQLQCDSCGAETHAACSCGAIYRPKSERAAVAVAAHPEMSNRAIADEIGVSEPTVRRARASHDAPELSGNQRARASHDAPELSGNHSSGVPDGTVVSPSTPGMVTGRDGKHYPASKPREGYVSPVSAGKAAAADYHTADRVRNVLEYLVSEFDSLDLSRALCGCRDAKEIDRINRALERAFKHLHDVRAVMGQRGHQPDDLSIPEFMRRESA